MPSTQKSNNDLSKKNIRKINYCLTCGNSLDNFPSGQWPCITCSRNIIYNNSYLPYLVDHYIQNFIEQIEE